MSPWRFISLTFTAPSLALRTVLRVLLFDCFGLLWDPIFWDSARIRKTRLVIAEEDHQGIHMEYDELLSCQGLRPESLEQPLRWICYEADKERHCGYCTLLYSEGHVGWLMVTTEVIDLRSFSERSRSNGRCDSAPPTSRSDKENKRKVLSSS